MTLGELENSMQSAIDNINQLVIDTKIDKVKRKKKDYRRLRTFNMRGVQVNIKNVKNEDTAAYEKALKVFNERNGENIYLWDYDRKSRLIINSQSSVKKRFIRSRSLSSSSSDNSPVRNREPSPSPKLKKSVEQGSDSETDSQKESNKKAEKHQKKPELKRGKDEKKNRDPNKFKIPKVSQVAENKQTLKSILEEGLKKGVSTPQKSYHSPQTRHVGRYQDWRKEQRIKEVVRKKEKVIDIKKVNISFIRIEFDILVMSCTVVIIILVGKNFSVFIIHDYLIIRFHKYLYNRCFDNCKNKYKTRHNP